MKSEERLERCYKFVQGITAGLGDKDTHDALNAALHKDKAGYEDVSLGLLVLILAEPAAAAKSWRDLTMITRDGFLLVLNHLAQLVLERYLRLNDVCRAQLLWLLREMIRTQVSNVENLVLNVLRHAAGGDVSPRNVSLVETLLDVFVEHRAWLDKYPFLVASVVYTYLRLIEDHGGVQLAELRRKEVAFTIKLMRERFADCLVIGRDLVRLLQNVARIPEFEQLWRDLLTNPKVLSANFSGVLQLMQTRTSRRFLQSRLTPEIERKLVFLTSQVRFGNHKRYQDWFQRQYLATPESQSLRCDMIRFIVGVIHPTNELLSSDIIPRWAVIGWLLTTCTSNLAAANAKLALFYDWLFYDSDKDNIMNIEPAILVMHHSMRSHPVVSATLLDFLCRIIVNFHPPLTERVRAGVRTSLRQILDKRVLPSLIPLFDNNKLDRELRNMVREMFKEFCCITSASTTMMESASSTSKMTDDVNINLSTGTMLIKPEDGIPDPLDPRLLQNSTGHNNNISDGFLDEPAFSDEEDDAPPLLIDTNLDDDDEDDDDIPLSKIQQKEKVGDRSDDSILDGPIRLLLQKMQHEKDTEKRCLLTDNVVAQILDLDEDSDAMPMLAKQLSPILEPDLKVSQFPKSLTGEALRQSIKTPIFSIFRTLYGLVTKQDVKDKSLLLQLLAELYPLQPSIGYLLLYFLKVQVWIDYRKDESTTKATALKVSIYREFCQFAEKKVDNCLYDDLTACHLNDTSLMMWIVPDLYKDFKPQTVNNAQILRVILSAIDAAQLQELISRVLQGRLNMFKNDSLQSLLKTSLSWESIEQYFLWQLIQAHNIALDSILPLVSHLDYAQHAEALTAITLMLKHERPTTDMIKYLFSRDVRDLGDPLLYTLIKYWSDHNTDKVAELVAGLLSTRYPATSPNKRKTQRGGGANKTSSLNSTVPSADQVLGHLENLRLFSNSSAAADDQSRHNDRESSKGLTGNITNSNSSVNAPPLLAPLYNMDAMQRALQVAHSNSSDSQRKQYQILFALAQDSDDDLPGPTSGGGSGGGSRDSAGGGSGSSQSSNSSSSSTVSAFGALTTTSRTTNNSVSALASSNSLKLDGKSSSGGSGGTGGSGSSSKSTGRGRKAAPKATTPSSKRGARDLSDISDDSTEEEEIVKPKQAKKRKKVMSDSD